MYIYWVIKTSVQGTQAGQEVNKLTKNDGFPILLETSVGAVKYRNTCDWEVSKLQQEVLNI